MIESIKIDKLFGYFDYQINLPEMGDYLILTGPNGYGKTTILNIIENLSIGNLLFFFKIPFVRIEVLYNDNNRLIIDNITIKKEEDDLSSDDSVIENHNGLRFSFIDNKVTEVLEISQKEVNKAREKFERENYLRVRFHHSYDVPENKKYNVSLRKKEYTNDLEILEEFVAEKQKENFLILINSKNIETKFILAQRLYELDESESSYKNSIDRVAEQLQDYLEAKYYDFLKNSQSRDSHFIETLMNENESISEEDYKEVVKKLREIADNAKKYDLLSDFKFPDFIKDKSVILKCFIEDAKNKFKIYKNPLAELNLYDSLLKEKMLVNKIIKYSRRYGIKVFSVNNKGSIPLEALSSGEKNEMVMLHDFIFNLKDNSILMIDEPEISLHVAWQQDFLSDIKKIAEQKKLHVIIATHSPQIIDGRWDDCYDLYEANEEETEL